MKILVTTYTHGDEHPPKEWENIPSVIANPKAKEAGVRFVEADLNRCFNTSAPEYESQRARELLPLIQNHDLVIDIHRTTAPSALFTAIITKRENIKYALPFAPEAVVIMKDAKYSLIGNAKAGVVLEYPTKYKHNISPPMYEALEYVPAQKGWKDFKAVKYNGETVYPYLVGEKAYHGNCFVTKLRR